MAHERLMYFFVFLMGAFTLAAAVFQWGFFMNHRKARFLQRMIGRTGARVFYAALGLFLVVIALAGAGGW